MMQFSQVLRVCASLGIGAACCALAGAIGGCASGGWLERPLEAELPVEPPPKSYPTAVRGQLDDGPPPEAAAASPAPPPPQRSERPPQLATPLAVIPPQFVRGPQAASSAPASALASPSPSPSPNSAAAIAPAPAISAELTAALPADLTSMLSMRSSSWPPAGVVPAAAADIAAPSTGPPTAPVAAAATPAPKTQNATKLENATKPQNAADVDLVQPIASQEAAGSQSRIEQARRAWIDALEEEIRQRRSANETDDELPRLEQQLRLLYLAAGRLDEAVEAVPSLDTQHGEAYKHLMFGLGVWLSPDESRRAPLRSAKVLRSLRDATGELATVSKLEVRRLAFCERVDYFGWYTEFPKNEFRPRQEVILYAEVDNFTAEQKGPAAFETELQGQYEIFDASGQSVASRQLQLDKETCRNLRRDYYLAYKIYLPDNIAPGRYRLELTIEDLKARGAYQGRKLGDGVLEFTIK